MRILWLSEYYPFPPHDGNALPIHEFARRMAARAEVTLLTHAPAEAEREALGRRECAAWGARLELVRRAPLGRLAQAAACLRGGAPWINRFFSPEFARRARELMAEAAFDRVVSEGILSAQHAPAAWRARHVLLARDCLSLAHQRRWQLTRDPRQWLQARKIAAMERALFRRAARVMAISPVDAAAMRRLSPDSEFFILPNGVDLNRFRPANNAEDPFLVAFSGDFSARTNADAAEWLLRNIWPLVRAAEPRARLRLAGRGATPFMLQAAAPDVEVTGPVADMPAALAPAGIIACPLRLGTGIKNKLLEGAALQKAMVATPLSLEGLAFEPGRDLISAQTAHDFAAGLITLMHDAGQRRQLGLAARNVVVKDYDWNGLSEILFKSINF